VVKAVFLLKFHPNLDPEEGRRWWYEEHGRLALDTLPGLLRYVQNHVVRPVGAAHAAGGMPFDGIAEIWFESREAYDRAVATTAGRAVVDDGAVGFAVDSSWAGFAVEHVMCWDDEPDGRSYAVAANA
jgi:uncharacterized protein (TIGR02118 family)